MAETSAPVEKTKALFVYDFVDVAVSLDMARQWCEADGRRLAPLAYEAGCDAEALLLRIGPSWAAGRLSKEVRVELGACRERGEGVAVSIRWQASQLRGLFPVLDGDLEFAPLGVPHCRLILSASYLAPFGQFGRQIDRALMHRVAESTVRSFLVRLGQSLETGQAQAGPSA